MKEPTVDYALRTTWLAIKKMYNEQAVKYDSTMATGFVLLSIDKTKGTPSTSLGPKMGMEATSLSRTLKKMEKKGLIERKSNPNDGRGVLLFLTPYGKETREYAKERVLTFNKVIKNKIEPEKLKHFFEVTQLITSLISNKKIYNQQEPSLK